MSNIVSKIIARLSANKETAAPKAASQIIWTTVRQPDWQGLQPMYAKMDDFFVVVVPDSTGIWYGYLLHANDSTKVISWASGRTNIMALVKNVARYERRAWKGGTPSDTVKKLAESWIKEYLKG